MFPNQCNPSNPRNRGSGWGTKFQRQSLKVDEEKYVKYQWESNNEWE
jgi:hypothetical protein